MVRTHQTGQAVFRSILPEDIDWKLPGVPTFGSSRRRCRSTFRAWPLNDQRQSALRREAVAT
jgi:hypothetical protein